MTLEDDELEPAVTLAVAQRGQVEGDVRPQAGIQAIQGSEGQVGLDLANSSVSMATPCPILQQALLFGAAGGWLAGRTSQKLTPASLIAARCIEEVLILQGGHMQPVKHATISVACMAI